MRQVTALLTCLSLAAAPLAAQARDPEQGRSLMERGIELFLKGLNDEVSPAVRSLRSLTEEFGPAMQSFLSEMGPAFKDLLGQVKDWSAYEKPEILPNGDIIIRRKPDAPKLPENPDKKPDRSTPKPPLKAPESNEIDI